MFNEIEPLTLPVTVTIFLFGCLKDKLQKNIADLSFFFFNFFYIVFIA